MGKYIALVVLFFVTAHIMQKNGIVSGMGRRRGGLRRVQNYRTRFQQRINRLGPSKIELLKSGKLGANRGLPTGFALIGGQLLDTSNKVIQKQVLGGTAYFSYQDKLRRRPLYTRPGNEAGWNFVVFQDPFYWRGSGHLILLKKVLGVSINQSPYQRDQLYEGYAISLRASMHPRVNIRDPSFRRKLERRRKKFEQVQKLRKDYRKPGRRPHLKDRKVRGKRKKRNVLTFTEGLDSGDCIVTKLNMTSILQKTNKMLKTHSGYNSNSTVKHKQHNYMRAMPIKILPGFT